jgi:hypothetical protein
MNCPYCNQSYDIDPSHAGERVLCVVCNGWSLLVVDEDGARLVRCVRPVVGDDEEMYDYE